MSEDKKSLIDLVPDSVDNAFKNITDKPTQNMGTTFADIWYLVFGGISQAVAKRKLKYSYALQEFEKELKEKISKIPEDKLVEPNIQFVAPALEAAKFCVENEKLRTMFSSYIASSMNIDTSDFSQPIFIDILKNMKPFECQIINSIYKDSEIIIQTKNKKGLLSELIMQIYVTINKLNSYGLIESKLLRTDFSEEDKLLLSKYVYDNKINEINKFLESEIFQYFHVRVTKHQECLIRFKLKIFTITPLGAIFKMICIE